MRHKTIILFMLGMLISGLPSQTLAANDNLQTGNVYGHVEDVLLMPGRIQASARLDTGARTSSLHARDIEPFEKNGEKWVRFHFDDHDGGLHPFSLPLKDEITVTQASGTQTRYVVKLGLCVGEHYSETKFTLTDRSQLTYPILVGRRFLAEGLLVSSEHDFTASPECAPEAWEQRHANSEY